ncbi:MAG: O-methyltransferase [Thermodesulfobacteriota bacterium]|nr:O-methyltransferase [Thermodesulfobacteriota bacterium]
MPKMIPDLEKAFRKLAPARDVLLKELEAEARHEKIPIIGPVMGELLYVLARAMDAGVVLELGTATGYSAIYLGRACKESMGRMVTLERDKAMAKRAMANFKSAGLDGLIEVIVGDALAEMEKMHGAFDIVFMDVDKEDYLPVLSHCHRLLRKGGLLIADNVAFQGADDFNRALSESPDWRAVHLLSFLPFHSPEKDGLCLALRM